jgi:hypothetical protein
MPAPWTAYIDMEFAGIRGTRQGMQIPIEIGVVLHEPVSDTISFAGRAFCHDVEVELWKNVTNHVGKRVDGYRRVFNLSRPGETLPEEKYRLDAEKTRRARTAIAGAHADIRTFMQTLNAKDIDTLVFFARRREMETFQRAKVRTSGFAIRDLQSEIRHQYSLKEDVSLDRMSLVIGFALNGRTLSSQHFSYKIPDRFRYIIKPHKAIGDAARMLLVAQEFHQYPEAFEAGVTNHIQDYEAQKIPRDEQQTG